MMKPTKERDWEYVNEKSATTTKAAGAEQEELEDLWEDMHEDELDDMDPGNMSLTVSFIVRDTAATKRLANDKSV